MPIDKNDSLSRRCVSQHPSFADNLGKNVMTSNASLSESFALEHIDDAPEVSSSLTDGGATEVIGNPKTLARRQVSFTSLEIREYPVVPGSHPQCSGGCPIELGWDYHSASELPLDQYESVRSPRRPRDQLRLSVEERESLLSANDCTAGEVRRAARRHHRTKSCEERFCQRSMQAFFQK
mmetsp:Transcript_25833/g.48910  ORF Transcript_25833/g.48910 Transcript_25833/m.48910 type:complete len:180 (-) Transcript_25833:53-592(-)